MSSSNNSHFKNGQGIKFLPPGFHLVVYSAPPSAAALEAEGLPSASAASSSSTPFGEGITIRHGLFRLTKPKEIVLRRYDDESEAVDGDELDGKDVEDEAESTVAKRLKSDTGSSIARSSTLDSSKEIEGTIISSDYLKTLDPKLAPYPFEKQTEWKRLTSLITSHTLETVLEADKNGDSRCDSLMSSLADEYEGTSPSSSSQQIRKSQWGKERKINEIDEMDRVMVIDDNERKDWQEDIKKGRERCMRFANFDLKRSWRVGALGEEITRDSRDKSWVSVSPQHQRYLVWHC